VPFRHVESAFRCATPFFVFTDDSPRAFAALDLCLFPNCVAAFGVPGAPA